MVLQVFILVLSVQTGVLGSRPCPPGCEGCHHNNSVCVGPCKYEHNYGDQCDKSCPDNCEGGCSKLNGSCIRCLATYSGEFCKRSCPTNCQSNCDMNTMKCDNCKYGFIGPFCNETCQADSSSTSLFNSSCIEPCAGEGKYGDDCDKPCPKNCRDGCYRDSGLCVNCADGFGGRSCNEVCAITCLAVCGRYHGNCNDCKTGFSGRRCSQKCPTNCIDKCDQVTGHCIGCASGFQGEECNKNCPQKCHDGCHQTTGVCMSCEVGYIGPYCGGFCRENCEDGCAKITGECMLCIRGFTGRFCNETCPINCLGSCDQYTGECDLDSEYLMTLKISIVVTATLFGVMLVVVIVKRRQLSLNRNQREYLNAIPESKINRESSCTAHRYYDIEDINLVNDHGLSTAAARSNTLPARDVRLPPPLPSQRKPPRRPALDDNLRLSSSPPSQVDAPDGHQLQDEVDPRLPPPLPCQGDPPPHDDAAVRLPPMLSCKRDATKPSYPRRVNHHFHCDNIFENEIYESADEAVLPEVGITLPFSEGKEEKDLLEEEAEHLKYSVAVGGAPALGHAYPEAPAVAAVDTHAVTEVSEDDVDAEPSVNVEDASGGQDQAVRK